MQPYLIVKFSNIGAAYFFSEQVFREKLELIELAPLGNKSQVIVRGEPEHLQSIFKNLGTLSYERADIYQGVQQEVIESYFSRTTIAMKKSVLIIESSYFGDLFQLAAEATTSGIQIVDLRMFRSEGSYCVLTLTDDSLVNLNEVITIAQQRNLVAHLLENLSGDFRNRFDYSVKS